MNRDELFDTPIVKQFEFDDAVVSVFDDMVNRSVPFYAQTQQLIVNYLSGMLAPQERVYDLGCSTASTLLALEQKAPHATLIGIDSAHAMIEQALRKKEALESRIELVVGDIVAYEYLPSRAIICNYTLQFVRPLKRQMLLQKIYDALLPQGVLVLSEKLIVDEKRTNKQFIDLYYDYKKAQGYSSTQIAQKREALENVLVPYSYEENVQMLKMAGFSHVEVLFRWVNFATFVAIK
ncbi:MAG: tRNA methyltransferase [Sulfuricurvum sp. PC08-66]|nr:MAG: tRNA methyltransferase [Sulfuricurvum sp. PC08-66]